MNAYYAFSAKSLQEYVFGSGRLVEVAGASAIIEALCTRFPVELDEVLGTGGHVLNAAAGSFRMVFPNAAEAHRFARHVPLGVAARAPGLAWVQAVEERAATGTWRLLAERLAAARNIPIASLPETPPCALRSPRTGEAMADVKQVARVREGMDAASVAKIAAYDTGEAGWGLDLERRLLALVRQSAPAANAWARDVDMLAGDNERLAVIHADGNRLGSVMMGLGDALAGIADPEKQAAGWRRVSDAIQTAAETAFEQAFAACAALTGDRLTTGTGAIRMRPVVLAGDDLTVIMPARWSMTFVNTYCTAFEAASAKSLADAAVALPAVKSVLPTCLTVAAGIALVKRDHPFLDAYDLAESLCGNAKRTNSGAAAGKSAASFHRVTGGTPSDYGEVLARHLTAVDGTALTANPWPCGDGDTDLGGLLRLVERLAAMPSTPWRRLVDAAQFGGDVAAALRRIEVVAADGDGSAAVAAVFDTLRAVNGGRGAEPLDVAPVLDALALKACGMGSMAS